MKNVYVNLSLATADPETLTRALEAMSRAMTGMALEGVDANLSATQVDEEDLQ